MIWLFGSKSGGKDAIVRKQNPDLNTLRAVISEPNALSALRAGYPLEKANEIGIDDAQG